MFTISRGRLCKKEYCCVVIVCLCVSFSADDSMHFVFKTQLPGINQSRHVTICEVKQILQETVVALQFLLANVNSLLRF